MTSEFDGPTEPIIIVNGAELVVSSWVVYAMLSGYRCGVSFSGPWV